MVSSSISLTHGIPYAISRVLRAQSVQRCFARWLSNERIQAHELYAPLIQEALAAGDEATLSLALDTTLRWEQYGMLRVSVM